MTTLDLPDIPDLILMVQVGSRAYGTSAKPEGSGDHDFVAITMETPAQVFGHLQPPNTRSLRSQPQGKPSGESDWDITVHPLRRWAQLAAKGNPNSLEVLWAPIISTTWAGDSLRDARGLFLGRHILKPYLGYIKGQIADVQNTYEFPGKQAMHAARLAFQATELLTTGRLSFPMPPDRASFLRAIRNGQLGEPGWASLMRGLTIVLEELGKDPALPEGPDLQAITDLVTTLHLKWWGSYH